MYEDAKRVRKPYARLNLDAYESDLIDALVAYTGMERATLLRHLIMREAVELVGVDPANPNADRRGARS